MDKLIYTGDNDALVEACGGVLVRFFDSGHVKSAASSAFSDAMIRENMPDDDHFGIHAIAMGCGEDYGFNKNGDWWTRDGLVHESGNYGVHTFVKNGAYYEEHNNRGPEVARGKIAAAAYNWPMQRAELIIHGDKRKAEEDYQAAKAGRTLTFSMSARVPDDECSCCSNRAKRSKEYCRHLKQSMTQYLPQFSKFAYAINHKPNFFDISKVRNPADRIAHWLQYILPEDEMAKAASANGSDFLFSDLQAKLVGVNLPEEVRLGCSTPNRQMILEKLAKAELYHNTVAVAATRPGLVAQDEKFHFAKYAAPFAFDPFAVTDEELAAMRRLEPDVLFGHLAKRGAVLPFLTFYAYVTGQSVKQASLDPVFDLVQSRYLEHALHRALETPADVELEELFAAAPSVKIAAASTEDPIDQVMDGVAEKTTMQTPVIRQRILRICSTTPEPCGNGIKAASEPSNEQKQKAQIMAQSYAMYKVAFVEAALDLGEQMTVDEPSLLLITYPQKV